MPSPTRIIAVALALLLAAGLVGEVILRFTESDSSESVLSIREQLEIQESIPHSPFIADPELGTLLAPSRENPVETPEYNYTLRTDHAGFPNPEPWPASIDVVVLGNSLINGSGLGYDGQFTTLLQNELGGRGVLNFSLHGGGTEHYRLMYQRYAASLRPPLVIAALWLTWDINNSLTFRDWQRTGSRPDFTAYRHSYGATHPSRERVEPSRGTLLRGKLRSLIDSSYLLRAAHRYSKVLRGIRDPVERVVLADGQVQYLSARDEKRLMRGWDRAGAPDLREIFFRPLEQLQAEVEASGGRFLVVLIPCKEELYAAAVFPEVLGPVQEARKELTARRIPTLDLYPVFGEVAASRPAFYRTDPHLNELGHQIVAKALAAWIAQEHIFGLNSP